MGVARVRNQNDDGWIVIGGGVEVVQQASEPAETYPGMLWLDTDEELPSGKMVLIESKEASNDATIELTDFGNYSKIVIILETVKPATDGADLRAVISNDGGSSWKTLHYNQATKGYTCGGSGLDEFRSDANYLLINDTDHHIGNANGEGIDGRMECYGVGDSNMFSCWVSFIWRNAATMMASHWGGMSNFSYTGFNAIKFYMSTGNILSGTFLVYGIKDS